MKRIYIAILRNISFAAFCLALDAATDNLVWYFIICFPVCVAHNVGLILADYLDSNKEK